MSAGLTGAGYVFRRDTASRLDGRRLRPAGVRGPELDTGEQALSACAVLLLITTKLLAPAARRAAFDPTGPGAQVNLGTR